MLPATTSNKNNMIASACVRVRKKIKRPDVAPRIGTNIVMVMREGIVHTMRASRHPIPDNV
jgi:hypothetical protein